MTGGDRARHHRVNACGQEHGQWPAAVRLRTQRQQRQGREVDLKQGDMMHGLLWFLTGEQRCVDVWLFVRIPEVEHSAVAVDDTRKRKFKLFHISGIYCILYYNI